jgi:hypothetical protein
MSPIPHLAKRQIEGKRRYKENLLQQKHPSPRRMIIDEAAKQRTQNTRHSHNRRDNRHILPIFLCRNDEDSHHSYHGVNTTTSHPLKRSQNNPIPNQLTRSNRTGGEGKERNKIYSSVIPVAAPHTMLNTVNTNNASRIMNLAPKISLNFA